MRNGPPSPETLLAQHKQLPGLIAVVGNEPLLVLEAADAVRQRANKEGFSDRHSFVMDARSSWQQISLAAGAGSLFGDRQLIEISLPSGKPGKSGAQSLINLAQQHSRTIAGDALLMVKLPGLDRQTRESQWCKTLLSKALVLECPEISRQALPGWIEMRLRQQGQSMDQEALSWMADHVEGNLLAAHQEIQKLGLLFAQGQLDTSQVQSAVMNVARFDVFALRDAMLDSDPARFLRVLEGLKAEGQALPLVLWAVSEEIRTMVRICQAIEQGQSMTGALKAQRVFGPREQRLRRVIDRMSLRQLQAAVEHAHEIDRIIKGIAVNGRMTDAWQELARLGLRVALGRTG